MERFSLEVKVGLVVVTAIALVFAFIFILGDWNPFTNTYRVNVTLDYAGGIDPGSNVYLAGAKVGKVEKIVIPDPAEAKDGHVLELVLLIDINARKLIREDSTFAIRMESLLGGKIVEITPGSAEAKVLNDGDSVRGVDPPNLEDLIGEGISILEGLKKFMDNLKPEDRERLANLLVALSRIQPEDVDDLRRAINNAADATEDLKEITAEIKPEVGPMVSDLRSALDEVSPTLAEARRLIRKLDKTLTEVRAMAPEDEDKVRAKVEELLAAADDLSAVADRLDRFTARMEKELDDVDREELERIIREFFQQEGITINVGTIVGDPDYPNPPPRKKGLLLKAAGDRK